MEDHSEVRLLSEFWAFRVVRSQRVELRGSPLGSQTCYGPNGT